MRIPAQRAFNRFVFLLGAIAIAQSPLMLRASKLGQIYHILIAGGGLMMVGGAAHEIRQEPRRRCYWHACANGRLKRTHQPMLVPLASRADQPDLKSVGKTIPVIYNAPTKAEALRILDLWRQYQIQARLDEQAQAWNKDGAPQEPTPKLQPSSSTAVHLKQSQEIPIQML